jgi:hypothetical protein
MWHLLGDPPVFQVIEVGSGDGALAQAIVHACGRMAPRLAQALYYVAADYEPRWLPAPAHPFAWDNGTGGGMSPATVSTEGLQLNAAPSPSRRDTLLGVQRVKTAGLRAFRNVVGCILCNELIDNFPVHRFAIQGGRIKEVFVTSVGGQPPAAFRSAVPRPSHQATPESSASCILSGMSRRLIAAPRRAASRCGTQPLRAGGAGRPSGLALRKGRR